MSSARYRKRRYDLLPPFIYVSLAMSQLERPIFDIIAAQARLDALGMSVAELGRRIGLTRQAVGHWLRGRGEPDMRQLRAMAKELGCHWLELVKEDATVVYKTEEVSRVNRIRELDEGDLAELDAYLAFKAGKH